MKIKRRYSDEEFAIPQAINRLFNFSLTPSKQIQVKLAKLTLTYIYANR